MFATVKCYSCFWLLLWLALSLLLEHAYAQRSIGDSCSTPQGPGVCRLSDQCQEVFIGLRSGIRPVNCGFQRSTPIVCCPTENSPSLRTTTPWIWEVVTPEITIRSENPPSKQVCKEYEQWIFNAEDLIPASKRRIINGTAAKALEFPHMVGVGFNNGSTISWECGGTLISDRFVLTAAHCLYGPKGEPQWVRLGYVGPLKSISEPLLLRISERIRHPQYTGSLRYNDIALLKLPQSITFTSFIRPACLDNIEHYPAGEETVATGWGLTDIYDDSRSADLLKVTIPIVAYSNCAGLYTDFTGLKRGLDDRTQICAGENGKDTCQGDSGGPLVIKKKKKALSLYRLIGVTSFGQSCGSIVPGVYTRVAPYLPWIESIVWPERSS